MPHIKLESFSKNQSIIIELISIFFIIIGLILITVQGFENDTFKKSKSREAKTEKLLYNIFRKEIYSNLLLPAFVSQSNDYYNYPQDLIVELNINSYFDCRGAKDGELNEEICQDKLINNNYTCCKAECCSRTNGGQVFCTNYNFELNSPNINNPRILNYDREEYFDDPRRKFCTYCNEYDMYAYNFNNQKILIYKVNYTYKDLLLDQVPYACINYTQCRENYIDCGIIDTMHRHLFVSDGSLCPVNNFKYENQIVEIENLHYQDNTINNKHIILRNVLAEIPPNTHENNFYFYFYRDNITKRDINNILKKSNNIYTKIKDVEFSLDKFNINIDGRMNKKTKLNLYTTNYIGFRTTKDYLNFKKYFPQSDYYYDNLQKIVNEIYPHFEHIIVVFPLFAIFLTYIIFFVLVLVQKINREGKKFIVLFIIKFILLISMFILEIIFYVIVTDKFEEINIDLDINFKEILDLYNKRRYQLYFLLSIIFLSLAFVPYIVFFIINCESDKIVENKEERNEINNNDNDIISNGENNFSNRNKGNNVNDKNEEPSERLNLNDNKIGKNNNSNNNDKNNDDINRNNDNDNISKENKNSINTNQTSKNKKINQIINNEIKNNFNQNNDKSNNYELINDIKNDDNIVENNNIIKYESKIDNKAENKINNIEDKNENNNKNENPNSNNNTGVNIYKRKDLEDDIDFNEEIEIDNKNNSQENKVDNESNHEDKKLKSIEPKNEKKTILDNHDSNNSKNTKKNFIDSENENLVI